MHRPTQLDPIVGTTAHQQIRVNIPGIDDMLTRQQVFRCQGSMDRRGHLDISRRRQRRLDIDDQIRPIGVARLGHVRFIPGPRDVAFDTEARVGVIGGVDQQGARRKILG